MEIYNDVADVYWASALSYAELNSGWAGSNGVANP